jgi:hypothetical protein
LDLPRTLISERNLGLNAVENLVRYYRKQKLSVTSFEALTFLGEIDADNKNITNARR